MAFNLRLIIVFLCFALIFNNPVCANTNDDDLCENLENHEAVDLDETSSKWRFPMLKRWVDALYRLRYKSPQTEYFYSIPTTLKTHQSTKRRTWQITLRFTNMLAIASIIFFLAHYFKFMAEIESKEKIKKKNNMNYRLRIYYEQDCHMCEHLAIMLLQSVLPFNIPIYLAPLEIKSVLEKQDCPVVLLLSRKYSTSGQFIRYLRLNSRNLDVSNLSFAIFDVNRNFAEDSRYGLTIHRQLYSMKAKPVLQHGSACIEGNNIEYHFEKWCKKLITALELKTENSQEQETEVTKWFLQCKEKCYTNNYKEFGHLDWVQTNQTNHPYRQYFASEARIKNLEESHKSYTIIDLKTTELAPNFECTNFDQICLVCRNKVEDIVHIVKQCNFDPNLIVETTIANEFHDIQLRLPHYAKIGDILEFFIDLSFPLSAWSFKILKHYYPEHKVNLQKHSGRTNSTSTIIDVLKSIPTLKLDLEIFCILLPQMKYIPTRICDKHEEYKITSMMNKSEYALKYLANNNKELDTIFFFFARAQMELNFYNGQEIIFIAQNNGIGVISAILTEMIEHNEKKPVNCKVHLFLEFQTEHHKSLLQIKNLYVHSFIKTKAIGDNMFHQLNENINILEHVFESNDGLFFINVDEQIYYPAEERVLTKAFSMSSFNSKNDNDEDFFKDSSYVDVETLLVELLSDGKQQLKKAEEIEVSNLYSLKGTMDRLDYLKSVNRYLYQIYQS